MQKLIPYIILFTGIILIYIFNALKKYKRSKIRIPANWKMMRVNLDNCEVFPYEHIEEEGNKQFPSTIEILDSLYSSRTKKENDNKITSIIVYSHHFDDGEVKKYKSDLIYLDPVTIKYYLINNKCKLVLYLDPINYNNYYLSLSL